MPTAATPFPDTQTLRDGLASVLGGERGAAELRVLERKPMVPQMTYPAEVVTCRLGEGSELRLYCKYEAGRNHYAHGHRGGVGYEAEVYRRILRPLRDSTHLFFYGAHTDAGTRDMWLILQYLEGGILLRDLHLDIKARPEPTEMGLAARWIGRFHAAQQERFAASPPPFLNRYGGDYYRGWARRTSQFAASLGRRFQWLAALGDSAEDWFAPLLEAPTVIHGEFYQNNILMRDRSVYPVDWESAAVAAGETDLAALTEGPWAEEIVRQCESEYQCARWGSGRPADFERRLDAARLYLHFRWLGERPDSNTADREKASWRFKELRAIGQRLGLI